MVLDLNIFILYLYSGQKNVTNVIIMKYKDFIFMERYTFQHKMAFLRVEHQLLGHNTIRGYLHDADKLLYLYPIAYIFVKDKKWVQQKHRAHNRHHVENKLSKTYNDYVEMVIDWECARYTKPDKQLSAYETMKKFYPFMEPHLLPIMKKFGLVR